MRLKVPTLIALATATASLAVAASGDPATEQGKRGQKLFLASPKGTACGTCHELNGAGTPVGPDLKGIASYAMPRGIAMAIRMATTETVQTVTLPDDTKFAARVVEKKAGAYKLWKLSVMPPALLTLGEKDIKSLERDQSWKHPPAAAGYSPAELADIIGYLRWVATGNIKTVTEDEVASSQ